MRLYLLEPYDVVTFGGLVHFGAGETHVQRSNFPPPIMRFFHIFKKVYGVFLCKDGELFLPFPADTVKERKAKQVDHIKILRLNEEGVPLIVGTQKAYEPVGNAYISYTDFVEKYMKGREDIEVYGTKDFFRREYRVGIGIDRDKKTVREGLLYSQEFLRLEKAYIAVLADGHHKDVNHAVVNVGGERRVAFLKEGSADLFGEKVQICRGKVYKFYCTSHLFLEGEFGYNREVKGYIKILSFRFKLLWLFSNGSEYISGFAKPFLYMLRPGSVLVLEALDSGEVSCRLCQIESKPPVNIKNFLERGWNSGVLMEVSYDKDR